MDQKIIAFDLGTGGNKALLYDAAGQCLASAFVPYATHYPRVGWHEQRPQDWWSAVVESTHQLLAKSQVDRNSIVGIGISGHSLGAVPVDAEGNLLREFTPIWSDIRAQEEVKEFFERVDPVEWYTTTGNGFPAACYTVFKVMWYRRHEPEMFSRVAKILGTKDFINFRLTGALKTDYSYASGTGIYDLLSWSYDQKYIQASGLPADIWPEIVPSTQILGTFCRKLPTNLGSARAFRSFAAGWTTPAWHWAPKIPATGGCTPRLGRPPGSPYRLKSR